MQTKLEATGTGFFITDDGCLVTNQHVADAGATVRVVTVTGSLGKCMSETTLASGER